MLWPDVEVDQPIKIGTIVWAHFYFKKCINALEECEVPSQVSEAELQTEVHMGTAPQNSEWAPEAFCV